MNKITHFLIVSAIVLVISPWAWTAESQKVPEPGQGTLNIIEPDGSVRNACPLDHTSVRAEISGFASSVTVTQTFHNPNAEKIEAIYTFPLPGDAAVNDMIMRVGDRVVRGEIRTREEARRTYEQAREKGHVASLLDQERPNIFTQAVANIMPGQKVEITIKYVEILPYADGSFTFVFPMVVGPRFIPGSPEGRTGTGWASDTDMVPDASSITPPVTREGTRAGHDIDISVSLDAGVPIEKIESRLHEVKVVREGKNRATVNLTNRREIPNRDFVLRYEVASDSLRSGVLTHRDDKEGYITLILIPPKRVKSEQVAPKEMIFVIDRSGSQRGKPLQKAKETIKYVIDHMNPNDTFNVIDFGSTANMLFSEPKKATAEFREKALRYVQSLEGNGGTWMAPAVELVCKTPPAEGRLRIVTFMTDGYVGNDFEIVSLVQRLRGTSRWFPFGTGNSVNRFLLDTMARVGGGEVDYVLLNSSAEEVGKKFYERISTPVLTDVSLTTRGISLEEIYPEAISDLWNQKPLVFKARYTAPGKGTVTIKGRSGGRPYEETLEVTLPEKEPAHSSLASLWARAKVDDLMGRDWMGLQRGTVKTDIRDSVIKVALEHRIMTQFTSFVAVEETVVTIGGKPTKVIVPAEMPDGVSREGVFGDKSSVMPQGAASPAFSTLAPTAQALGERYEGRGIPTIGVFARTKAGVSSANVVPGGQASVPAEMKLDEMAGKSSHLLSRDGLAKEERELSRKPEGESDSRALAVRTKLDPDLRALLDLKEPVVDYTRGKASVKGGTTLVQVWLSKRTDEILKTLKEKGLDISYSATAGNIVIGTIRIEKLADLADIKEVLRILPVSAG